MFKFHAEHLSRFAIFNFNLTKPRDKTIELNCLMKLCPNSILNKRTHFEFLWCNMQPGSASRSASSAFVNMLFKVSTKQAWLIKATPQKSWMIRYTNTWYLFWFIYCVCFQKASQSGTMTNIWKLFKIVSNCWKNCLELFWNCLTIDWKLFIIVYNCFKIVSKCSTKNQQTIAKPFLRKWFVEILQLIDIILKTDQFSPQMVCRDLATCICEYIHIWIQLQKTDQLSPQMVCRDFCCKCLCQTIVKQLSNYFTAILVFSNYCQNNCSNFWTIVKTIS